MGFKVTKKATAAMMGLTDDAVKQITDGGGTLDLPTKSVHVRLGGVGFPANRQAVLVFEVWNSAADARERKTQPLHTLPLAILPEPNVLQKEETDSNGEVLVPASVLPTFDAMFGESLDPSIKTWKDVLVALKAKAETLAMQTVHDFQGATKE